ncbi:hypothetical protein GON26_04495 [Flavobacterium sp. GA093]|uniref:Uncharacterized protein n=1 Tax=Flavobacterium hydrocarbonoxydans TaxID=2683249 RepID=A0A6I4NR81_9FLAO|nr:hypothetical protein [Flavobacterium hydrocarbonoxydans]MWB93607.1 hypothetical protein [Flavobacterium hydrocarbonoxydans]
MKKTITTIGLFSLVMALTSFTTSEIVAATNNASVDGAAIGVSKKVDFVKSNTQSVTSYSMLDIAGPGGQSTGGNRKVD